MHQALPPEVYYSNVIPDLLSEHLHRFLVYSESPDWNPFVTLPLVSRQFHASCRTLCSKIFGLEEGEGGLVIRLVLDRTKELWDQANRPLGEPPPRTYAYEELFGSKCLIQVYICTAIARGFLNFDVLWTLDLENRVLAGEFDEADEDEQPERDKTPVSNVAGFVPRRFRMRDDTMHRCYLPLACALRLCDRVHPERVAYIMADYLARELPLYATAPPLLKHTQDLETYILRENKLDPTWIEWTYQTLDNIQTIGDLIRDLRRMGKLVNSFNPRSSVPLQVIQDTHVIVVLETMADVNWGEHTKRIQELALMVKDDIQEPQSLNKA